MTIRKHESRTTSHEPAEVCEMRAILARFAHVAKQAVHTTATTQRALRDSFRPPLPQVAVHRMVG